MKNYFKVLLVTISLLLSIEQSRGSENESWYLMPTLGISQISNFSATSNAVFGATGDAEISIDSGFLAGLALGYKFNKRWSTEVAWEYRTNDSEIVLANGVAFPDGNYASNTFMLNGRYSFESSGRWNPFIGGGAVWIQEIDIDLEAADSEFSYSGDGDVGFQLFGGAGYQLTKNLELEAALRYSSIGNIDLEAEGGANGVFTNVDYQPISAQLSLKIRFWLNLKK